MCTKAQMKIIIVGASSGLGREIAIRYVQKGHRVAITGRREQLLLRIKRQTSADVSISCFDVAEENCSQKINELIAALGGLDLLVYNAGFGETSKELDRDIEHRTTKTNVTGFVEVVSFAYNYFVQKGSGQIAVTSSVAALRGSGWAPAYSASKAFMSNYAEGLNMKAKRLKKDIIVTDVRPGFLDTKPGSHKRFWITPADKAVTQIIRAIEKKKRIVYVSRRWWLVAQVIRMLPFRLYRRLV